MMLESKGALLDARDKFTEAKRRAERARTERSDGFARMLGLHNNGRAVDFGLTSGGPILPGQPVTVTIIEDTGGAA